MEVFKVGIKSHLRNGDSIIMGILVWGFCPNIFSFLLNDYTKTYVLPTVLVFVLFVLPGIIIHVNYYLVNKGDSLTYSSGDGLITITHKGEISAFSLDDIDVVEKNMSYNIGANRTQILPWDGYNHSVIHLKNGLKYTVTSLFVDNLNLPLEKDKVVVKDNLYRLVMS